MVKCFGMNLINLKFFLISIIILFSCSSKVSCKNIEEPMRDKSSEGKFEKEKDSLNNFKNKEREFLNKKQNIKDFDKKEIIQFLLNFLKSEKSEQNLASSMTIKGKNDLMRFSDSLRNKDFFLMAETAIVEKRYNIEKLYGNKGVVVCLGDENEIVGYELGYFFIENKNEKHIIFKINMGK